MADNGSFIFVDSQSELTEAQIRCHARRLEAYAVELVNLSKKDVYRYAFFVKKVLRRTLADKKKLFTAITNWKMDSELLYYNLMDYIIYYHVSRKDLPEKDVLLKEQMSNVKDYLQKHEGDAKETFTDCYKPGNRDVYRQLRIAVMYASRHDYVLIIANMQKVLLDSAFYDTLYEGSCEVMAVDFPLMCRQNLPMMRAMALYRETSSR